MLLLPDALAKSNASKSAQEDRKPLSDEETMKHLEVYQQLGAKWLKLQ